MRNQRGIASIKITVTLLSIIFAAFFITITVQGRNHRNRVIDAVVSQQANILAGLANAKTTPTKSEPQTLLGYPKTHGEVEYLEFGDSRKDTWVQDRNPDYGNLLINAVTGEKTEPSNSGQPGSLSYMGLAGGDGYTIKGYGAKGKVITVLSPD